MSDRISLTDEAFARASRGRISSSQYVNKKINMALACRCSFEPPSRFASRQSSGSNNSVVNNVGLGWVFVAGINNNSFSTFSSFASWPRDTMDLSLNSGEVPPESGHRIHVTTDHFIHEVDVLTDDVVEAFGHWCNPKVELRGAPPIGGASPRTKG